ncbi:mucin-17-like isoform X2 [Pseudophryne corroboree]|uniref:mucin-17-like isoform X2 n=1 Tax=Pseudophryne corroboree TaxID=495146 RepID=UPI0030816FB7
MKSKAATLLLGVTLLLTDICSTAVFTFSDQGRKHPANQKSNFLPEKAQSQIENCQNGGVYNGIMCVCTDLFYGSLCESFIDRVPPVRAFNTSAQVQIKIDKEYSQNLSDPQTPEYKEFEQVFKKEMRLVYSNVPGYQDVEILDVCCSCAADRPTWAVLMGHKPGRLICIRSCRHRNCSNSIVTTYEVIAQVILKKHVNLSEEHKMIVGQVWTDMTKAVTDNCTGSLCISDISVMMSTEPPSMSEICQSLIPYGFREFFSPLLTPEGLYCLSYCEPLSSNYQNCNGGKCEIKKDIGPRCFCPNTDQYMYISGTCTGKILKSGLYGGICVLVIIIITGAFFLYKAKRSGHKIDSPEDNEETFVKRGISNPSSQLENREQFENKETGDL